MKLLQKGLKVYVAGIFVVFGLAFNVYAEIDHGTEGVANTDIVTNILQITPGDPADPEAEVRDWVPCWGINPWSHDGEWIVYQTQVGEASGSSGNEIAIIKADGTEYQQVTYNDACDSHGNFTPDGTKIVFQRRNTENYEEIWTIDRDGNEQNLTQAHGGAVSEGGDERKPIVSPDGTKIAFLTRHGDNPNDIWVMDIDGTNPVRVYQDFDSHSAHHSWSPDSQWIVFKATETYGTNEYCRLYKVRPDGTDLTMLSDDVDEDFANSWAEWSPDGNWISYRHRYRDTDLGYDIAQIRLMDPNGGNKQTLVSFPAPDGSYSGDWLCGPHSWHPDSEWIAFKKWSDTSTGTEGSPIYIMNIYTDEIFQLTENYRDGRMWWGPGGRHILFKEYSWGSYSRDQESYDADLLIINLAEEFAAEPEDETEGDYNFSGSSGGCFINTLK